MEELGNNKSDGGPLCGMFAHLIEDQFYPHSPKCLYARFDFTHICSKLACIIGGLGGDEGSGKWLSSQMDSKLGR